MDLSAYTVSAVQTAAGLVRLSMDQGWSLEDLDRYLAAYVDEQTVLGRVLSMRGPLMQCPTEGCHGRLIPWPKSSAEAGVPIEGCLLCRYSRLAGAHNG